MKLKGCDCSMCQRGLRTSKESDRLKLLTRGGRRTVRQQINGLLRDAQSETEPDDTELDTSIYIGYTD